MESHVETDSHLAVRLFVVIIAASADLAGKAGKFKRSQAFYIIPLSSSLGRWDELYFALA